MPSKRSDQARTYQVKEVAEIANVTVRTLHHYDSIGLLVPSARSGAGYRLYNDDDLLRLQQVIIGRQLGLSLEEIRRSLDDPAFDRTASLLAQRQALAQQLNHTQAMIGAIDRALALLDGSDQENPQGNHTMTMKSIFDGFDPTVYEQEAKERWGHTDAYQESKRRTERYTEQEWQHMAVEQDSIYRDANSLLEAGHAAHSLAATDVAERHRLLIDRWFYPCSYAMHCKLADMYEADGRFAASIDKFGRALTPFLAAAIRANAQRHGQEVPK